MIMKTGFGVCTVKIASLDAFADRFKKHEYHRSANAVSFKHVCVHIKRVSAAKLLGE
jgi:hypothetical protein